MLENCGIHIKAVIYLFIFFLLLRQSRASGLLYIYFNFEYFILFLACNKTNKYIYIYKVTNEKDFWCGRNVEVESIRINQTLKSKNFCHNFLPTFFIKSN